MTKLTLTAIGDSQTTLTSAYNVPGWLTWTPQLVKLLVREGIDTRCRAFGIGGETTANFLARADVLHYYDAPAVVAINGGINDKTASVADATIQANLQALIKGAKFGVRGVGIGGGITVAGQADLPATGEVGDRLVVMTDTSTTGGVAAFHSSQAARIGGAGGSAQTVWECRYPGQTGERGWGRIATAATTPTHVDRIIVVGYGYENFTTGGDTPSTPVASRAALRADQQAAVTAENVTVSGRASVVYADVYTTMHDRIVAGTDLDFSSVAYDATKSWHQIQNDLHHNRYGHALVAQVCRAAMPNAWITELTEEAA